jgi:ABC-type nitrate/sulfonate/bicarbonate transport system permease component
LEIQVSLSKTTAVDAAQHLRSVERSLSPATISRIAGWFVLAGLLALWEISARFALVKNQGWPPFSDVLGATISGLRSGELPSIMASTLERMFTGFAIGSAVGIVLGLAIGTIPVLRYFLTPIIEAVRPLPIPAIVPPLILFLGIDDALKVSVVALSVMFPVLINTEGGVSSVDPVLLATARTFRKPRLFTLAFVIFPAVLPAIFAGLRISLSLALVTTVVAEMIAGSGGVGFYIMVTQYGMRPDQMYAAILCLAAVGYLLNRGFRLVERKLIAWKHRSEMSSA